MAARAKKVNAAAPLARIERDGIDDAPPFVLGLCPGKSGRVAMASDQDIRTAVGITGKFENPGDPFQGVTGDFDGMGISCGVLQWNIGSHSLQPLVLAVGRAVVVRTAPTIGPDLWTACSGPTAAALAKVRSWQTNGRLKAVPRGELQALMGSPEMRAEQMTRIRGVADTADQLASAWAHDAGRAARSLQEFIWFFDLVTQNGSLKGLAHHDVATFIAAQGASKADDVACNWLAAAPANWWGRPDCLKNAGLWRNAVAAADLELFVLSYLRSGLSTVRARGVVMNRKGTLATRKGWVNGALFDLTGQY